MQPEGSTMLPQAFPSDMPSSAPPDTPGSTLVNMDMSDFLSLQSPETPSQMSTIEALLLVADDFSMGGAGGAANPGPDMSRSSEKVMEQRETKQIANSKAGAMLTLDAEGGLA
ncbi:metal regulatory transcription factor 1-like [Arapaima gigas]